MRTRRALAVLTTLTALAVPSAALAQDAKDTIYKECQEGRITGTYTQKQYSDALRNIQTDLDEYTDCRDVIRRAQLAAAGGGAGGGNGADGTAAGGGVGGASPGAEAGKSAQQLFESASPAEKQALTEATGSAGAAPVEIGGRAVSPDTAGFSPDGAANVVPTPLIIALILLGLGLAAGGTQTIRSLVLTRRTPAT